MRPNQVKQSPAPPVHAVSKNAMRAEPQQSAAHFWLISEGLSRDPSLLCEVGPSEVVHFATCIESIAAPFARLVGA